MNVSQTAVRQITDFFEKQETNKKVKQKLTKVLQKIHLTLKPYLHPSFLAPDIDTKVVKQIIRSNRFDRIKEC